MTDSFKAAPVARAACHGRSGRPVLAPALFRLLSDSAMSRAALASCGAAVAIVDAQNANWPIAYLNPAFERLFGHRDRDVGGEPLVSLILSREPGMQDLLLEAVQVPHEICATHKNGTQRNVEIVLGPVHDSGGRLTHWVMTFTDRSEIARLRAELATLKPRRAA
jgi:PAS domain S-box-containing protein